MSRPLIGNTPFWFDHEPEDDGDWRPKAACLDHDPELFFPYKRGEGAVKQASEAAAVCINCPVYLQCGDVADSHGERYGVWAGVDYGAPEVRRQKARMRLRKASA